MNTNEIHFAGATLYDNQIVLKRNDNLYTLDCYCVCYKLVAKTHRLAYGMKATFLQLDFNIE